MKNFFIGLTLGMLLASAVTYAQQVKVSAQVAENECNTCIEPCREVCEF